MTDETDRVVTRASIERGLHELTGFKRDAAEIAAFMTAIDIYIASLTGDISEPHLHLLMQQAELLLDSGQSVAARMDRLAEQVAGQVEAIRLERISSPEPAVELTEPEREFVSAQLGTRRPPNTISDELVARLYELFEQGVSENKAALVTGISRSSANKYKNTWKASRRPAPGSEEALAAYQEASNELHYAEADAALDALITDTEEEILGVRELGSTAEVFCRTCRRWKGTDHFYKNKKSQTGYETKCRECRPPKVKAAAA